ncbi:hypothetical protein GCM10009779_02100 [Polymorphospora rubra]|uniref:Uncharacterized protein n=1 Tax=Polymorphospora rubra TaxID=338584 RepID=A0A810MX56_9ACTN|nr:hypothetical protein Prubr_27680 [Polymorphospora rubra]
MWHAKTPTTITLRTRPTTTTKDQYAERPGTLPITRGWTTGHFRVSDGDGDAPEPFRNLDAGAGAGTYSLRLAHDGRKAAREVIARVRRQTTHATTAESGATWHGIIGIERYLIRVWPATANV